MSFSLQIQTGEKSYLTDLPSFALSGLEKLDKAGHSHDVHQLVGKKDAEMGEARTVSRKMLLEAIERLLVPAKSLGSGFRVRWNLPFADHREMVGGGVAGLLIDGVYFGIDCYDDYWEMSPSSPSGPTPRKSFPPEMCGVHRYEPAEIKTENMGIVKVERKKGKREELVNLLNELKEFLETVHDESVSVTVG